MNQFIVLFKAISFFNLRFSSIN